MPGPKVHKPKMTYEVQYPFADAPEYTITDEFASKQMPKFKARRRADNPKTGWNTTPTHASRSGMASFQRPGPPERGCGKEVGRSEAGRDCSNDLRYPGPQNETKLKREDD
jgi:hypothetical protein